MTYNHHIEALAIKMHRSYVCSAGMHGVKVLSWSKLSRQNKNSVRAMARMAEKQPKWIKS